MLTAIYSPDSSPPSIQQAQIRSAQQGGVDCGLFAIAYAVDIANGEDPASFVYDQGTMRHHLLTCLESFTISPFPKKSRISDQSPARNLHTNAPSTTRWSTSPRPLRHPKQKPISPPVPTSNRFAALSTSSPSPSSTPSVASSQLPSALPTMTSASPSNSRASISPTQSPDQSSRQSVADRLKNRKSDPNSIVYNLSSKILSPSELSVLELGLSFSPSSKPVDNDLLATDVFQFVRKLKLREYFEERNNEGSNVLEDIPSVDEDRDPMKWQERNPSWYPEKVRMNRSEGLSRWVDGILDCINGELTTNKSKLFNNLSNDQRQALKSLSKDSSITIKPADKGGA